MTALTLNFGQIGAAAAESEDCTVNKKTERELPKAGPCLVRMVGYIETGRHAHKTNSTYKPALKAQVHMELCSTHHQIDFDGKKIAPIIKMFMNKGTTGKSGYRKLFKVLNTACGGGNQQFVQMIGKPFLAEIYHSVPAKEGDQQYANFDLDGAYSFKAPVQHDVVAGTETPIPVPELLNSPYAFLWENEGVTDDMIKDMWEAIYVEGEWENEDEKTKEVTKTSKNKDQEAIMANLEWEGSRTQALTQEHISLDDEPTEEEKAALAANKPEDKPVDKVDLAAAATTSPEDVPTL